MACPQRADDELLGLMAVRMGKKSSSSDLLDRISFTAAIIGFSAALVYGTIAALRMLRA